MDTPALLGGRHLWLRLALIAIVGLVIGLVGGLIFKKSQPDY